jgi:hypothetical protein
MSILTDASRAPETEPYKPLHSDDTAVSGTLHAYVDFDWSEEIHLD